MDLFLKVQALLDFPLVFFPRMGKTKDEIEASIIASMAVRNRYAAAPPVPDRQRRLE